MAWCSEGKRGGKPTIQNENPAKANRARGSGQAAGAGSSGAGGSGLASTAAARRGSKSPFHFATTRVATVLPMKFVIARASDMKRSTPRMSAMPATGTVPVAASVAAKVMKPEPEAAAPAA